MRYSWVEEYVAAETGLSQPLERTALSAWQLKRLNELLAYVGKNSRFYRQYPRKLDSLAQLATLPLIDQETVRQEGSAMICVSQSQISRVVTMETSGTTGQAKRLYYSAADLAQTITFFAAGLREVVAPDQRILVMMPNERPESVGDLILRGSAKLGAKAVAAPMPGRLADYAALLTRDIDAVVGLPGQILTLARYMAGNSLRIQPKAVLTSADHLSSVIKRELTALWGEVVVDHYGSTESGLGGAVECGAKDGRHIRESDLLCEIVDPFSGKVLPEGQWGELVITTLTREAMPLIRYRTGDMTRLLPGDCPCGSCLKRLDAVQRLDGHWLLPILEEILWPQKAVLDFALRQEESGMTLDILAKGSLTAAAVKACLPVEMELAIRILPLSKESAFLHWGKRRLL